MEQKLPIFLISLVVVAGFSCRLRGDIPGEKELEAVHLGDIEPYLLSPRPLPKAPDIGDFKKYRLILGERIIFNALHETVVSRVLGGQCMMEIGDKLEYINGYWAVKFRLEATSAKWYSWVYTIKDVVEGYFDIITSKTLYLQMDKQEQSYTEHKQVLFDYNQNLVIEKEVSKGKNKYKQYKLVDNVVDAYSIIYLIRRKSLEISPNISYTVYSNGKIYPMNAQVIDMNSKIEMSKKNIDTFKVKLLTKVEGALEQRGGIYVYFDRQGTHKPVLITADVRIGKFVLEQKI